MDGRGGTALGWRRSSDQANSTRKHRPDYWLLIISVALLVVGLIVVYAISPALSVAHNVSENYYITHQLIAIGLGAVAFLVTSRISLNSWRGLYAPLLVFAAIATLLALVMPVNADYPAHRWVRIGGFSFQSVELLKLAVLVWLAGLLAVQVQKGAIADSKTTLKPFLVALVACGVIVAGIQSDLGSAGVLVMMMGIMAFVAGVPMKKLLLVAGVITILTVLAISSTPYRRDRLATFLNPAQNCQTTGYQACQALVSVGSGGMFGLGLGRSVQAYGYLPEAANDSIFAIYAEKFGFVGVAVLLGLFAALFYRLKSLAARASDNFGRLFVVGVLTWLAAQTVINVGAMLGILPMKGITLPLVSYGGTSVVFVMAALGVVFQISKYANYAPVTTARRPGERRGV